MRKRICFAFVFLALIASCGAQTVVEVQEVKELKPTKFGNLFLRSDRKRKRIPSEARACGESYRFIHG